MRPASLVVGECPYVSMLASKFPSSAELRAAINTNIKSFVLTQFNLSLKASFWNKVIGFLKNCLHVTDFMLVASMLHFL